MTRLIETYLPPIQQDGYNSNKSITLGSSATLDMSGSTGTFKLPSGGATGTNATISGSGATVTLTAAQSRSIILMDKADGITFTLPVPVAGLEYTFAVSVTITSNSYKVITNSGSVFIAGSILASIDNTANKSWVGNGTTHLAITQSSASTNATGGIVGSFVRMVAVSTTLWAAYGLTVAGGTPTTPFATS